MSTAPTVVQPEALLKQLHKLWRTLGQEQAAEKPGAVLLACAMTLLVATNEQHDAEVAETIAALMHEHPSRAVVVRLRAGDEPVLEGDVRAHCWMPFGKRQQICCELIELTASRPTLDDLTPALLGLSVPDLPVVLWCHEPQLLRIPELRAMLRLADKVIVDSDRMENPAEALTLISELRGQGVAVADLAWTSLTSWRESVAQAFDNPEDVARLSAYREVVVAYGGEVPPVSARYLASWFRHVLEARVNVQLQPESGVCEGAIQRIELRSGERPVTITLQSPQMVQRETALHQCRQVFPERSDQELLHEELRILGTDRLFEAVLDRTLREARA